MQSNVYCFIGRLSIFAWRANDRIVVKLAHVHVHAHVHAHDMHMCVGTQLTSMGSEDSGKPTQLGLGLHVLSIWM